MTTDSDNSPELATNEEWRAIMVRARHDHGWSQEELGTRVGATQVSISKIESGENATSKYVLPICRELGIPEPQHFASDAQREWSELGHVLRHGNPEQYQAAIRLLRAMIGAVETVSDTPADRPPARRR